MRGRLSFTLRCCRPVKRRVMPRIQADMQRNPGMMENCMGLVLHNATLLTTDPLPGADATTLKTDLSALAWRIAHNREIAGFHYRSDTMHGRTLADDIFSQIRTDLSSTRQTVAPEQAMKDAQNEWATS